MKIWMRYSVLVDLDVPEEEHGYETHHVAISRLLGEAEDSAIDALETYALHVVDVEFRDWDYA